MNKPMRYIAQDGATCDFTVPRGVNRTLVARAVRRIHDGATMDAVTSPLTPAERDLLVEVVSTLEDHRPVSSGNREDQDRAKVG